MKVRWINMIGKSKIILFIMIVCILSMASGAIFAEDAGTVELVADSTNIQLGISTDLSIVFNDVDKAEIIGMTGIDNFEVLSTSQSSSTQFINGASSHQKQVTYTIMPKTTGSFDLTARVKINGVEQESNSLTIKVTEGQTTADGNAQDLFVKTIVSKEQAYVGEKVLLTYELYSRYNLEQFGFLDTVSINNGLLEEVPEENLAANYVMIDGNKYIKYEVKKYVTAPIKSGMLEIPTYKFQANITDGGFFSQSKPMYLQTDAKTITIMDVPSANKPKDYLGLVGSIKIESSYDKSTVAYGEPITLHIKLTGNANLDSIDSLVNEKASPEFAIYETDQPIQTDYSNQDIRLTKEAEIIIVPKEVGELTFAPQPISFFNTITGTYDQLQIEPLTINVTGEKPVVASETQNGGQSNSSVVNSNDKTPSKISVSEASYVSKDDTSYFKVKKVVVYMTLVLVVFTLLIIYVVTQIRKGAWIKKTSSKLVFEFNKASTILEKYDILCEAINDKYEIRLKAISKQEVSVRIEDALLAKSLIDIQDYMEYGRYKEDHNEQQIVEKMLSVLKAF